MLETIEIENEDVFLKNIQSLPISRNLICGIESKSLIHFFREGPSLYNLPFLQVDCDKLRWIDPVLIDVLHGISHRRIEVAAVRIDSNAGKPRAVVSGVDDIGSVRLNAQPGARIRKVEADDDFSRFKINRLQQHLCGENMELLLICGQRRRTGNTTERNFTYDFLFNFIDHEQLFVERPDVHQPLRRRLAACHAVDETAHNEQRLPHKTVSSLYGKTRSTLRQSFAADAHLSVQSGALFKWSGTCAGQPQPR